MCVYVCEIERERERRERDGSEMGEESVCYCEYNYGDGKKE